MSTVALSAVGDRDSQRHAVRLLNGSRVAALIADLSVVANAVRHAEWLYSGVS